MKRLVEFREVGPLQCTWVEEFDEEFDEARLARAARRGGHLTDTFVCVQFDVDERSGVFSTTRHYCIGTFRIIDPEEVIG